MNATRAIIVPSEHCGSHVVVGVLLEDVEITKPNERNRILMKPWKKIVVGSVLGLIM